MTYSCKTNIRCKDWIVRHVGPGLIQVQRMDGENEQNHSWLRGSFCFLTAPSTKNAANRFQEASCTDGRLTSPPLSPWWLHSPVTSATQTSPKSQIRDYGPNWFVASHRIPPGHSSIFFLLLSTRPSSVYCSYNQFHPSISFSGAINWNLKWLQAYLYTNVLLVFPAV